MLAISVKHDYLQPTRAMRKTRTESERETERTTHVPKMDDTASHTRLTTLRSKNNRRHDLTVTHEHKMRVASVAKMCIHAHSMMVCSYETAANCG